MNFTLLDSMIRPLTQDRQQPHENQHFRKVSPGSGKHRLLPGQQPTIARAESICQSKSIPIPIKHSLSEVQLHEEDEAMADYIDYCFYARLVNGITSRQEGSIGNHRYHRPADTSLANIIRTRNLPVTPEAADPEVLQARRQSFLGGEDDDHEEIFILDM